MANPEMMYNKLKPGESGFRKSFFCLLILISIFSCSKEELVIPIDVPPQVIKNVSYGADPHQVYDVYLPENRSATFTKVLVLVHGGGWIQGDKRDMNGYIPLMQENLPGYAIVNVNYRLAQLPARAAFPNQFLDLEAALKQISDDAVNLGILSEFALIGASAGGHLALQYDNLYDSRDQVKVISSIVGPTDLTDPFYSENPDFTLALQYLVDESQYPGEQDFAKAISPAYLVSGKSSPTILFYGNDDPIVPVSNGIFLKQQLDAVGVTNNLSIYEGGHGDWQERDNNDLILQLREFISTHLPMDD